MASRQRGVPTTIVLVCCFYPIPCFYTSLLHDGMATKYHFLIYMDRQEQANCSVWIHFYPTTVYLREKPFGQHWD